MNLAAIEDMNRKFPHAELCFVESGGDNLAATFSPELADLTIYVIDVAEGEKIPRKGGPGITRSDLLVINKIDLAPLVGANLGVMEADTLRMRAKRPFVFTNFKSGEGVDQIAKFVIEKGGLAKESDTLRWDWKSFRDLPTETFTVDLHCVTRWSKLGTSWEGVSVDTMLRPLLRKNQSRLDSLTQPNFICEERAFREGRTKGKKRRIHLMRVQINLRTGNCSGQLFHAVGWAALG